MQSQIASTLTTARLRIRESMWGWFAFGKHSGNIRGLFLHSAMSGCKNEKKKSSCSQKSSKVSESTTEQKAVHRATFSLNGRILGVEIAFGSRLLPCAARACHSCSPYSGLVCFLSIVESDQLHGLAPERSLLALAVLDPFESSERIWRVVPAHRPGHIKDPYTSWLGRIG